MSSNEKHKLSDEDLMGLYQSSDYMAFEILYKRHAGRLYEYLKSKVGADSAQELLQDTFARIHKSRDKYNPQYPFLPWVFTVARNILFDHFKRAETQTKHNTIDQDSSELGAEGAFSDFGSLDQLEGALSVLPEPQRLALKMRYLDDWTFEEIAKEFETTPQNARQLISRGLRKVKSVLEKKETSQ
jgi:RNA polymerase sigma factor (sigma-70 family)